MEPLLREELAQRELVPVRFAFSGVTIPDVGKLEALASIHVRFDMAPLNDAETGPRDFAQRCDALRALSGALACSIEGPLLGVEEKAPIEQEAIAEAVRNAYVGAEAAAAVMEYQVEGVQEVDVLALEWRTESRAESATPDFRRVACEARVKVTYTIESL